MRLLGSHVLKSSSRPVRSAAAALLFVTAVHLANCCCVLPRGCVPMYAVTSETATIGIDIKGRARLVQCKLRLFSNQTNTQTKMAFSTLTASRPACSSSRLTRPAPCAVAAAAVVPRTPARTRQSVALPPGRDSLRVIRRSSDTGAAQPAHAQQLHRAVRSSTANVLAAAAALALLLLLLPQVLKTTTSLCLTRARSCRAIRWAGGGREGEGGIVLTDMRATLAGMLAASACHILPVPKPRAEA